VVGVILFFFLAGLGLGLFLGRRSMASAAASPSPAPLAPPPVAPRTKPTRRAMKAGLTDASLTPADDILEKLRRAAEGELDPAELSRAAPPPPPDPAQVAADEAKAERERRVLERLRQQQPQSDLANERDNDDIR
jgi:hypothetical protein